MENRINGLSAVSSTSSPRLAAVIPALNEAQNIEAVVVAVRQRALAIVVDDGSTDETAMRAKSAGAYVVIHPRNKGYDAALETGIQTAIELGCSYAVTLDADGQHDPTLLDRFNEELEKGADLVVGERDRMQRWSESLFSIVGGFIWGLYDPLCGMKGYRLSKIIDKNDINTYASIGTELAIRFVRIGIEPHHLCVKTRARDGVSRFGSGYKANMRILKALLTALFR
jgi:glycosyltransferase involved in cell wall biosynthesis